MLNFRKIYRMAENEGGAGGASKETFENPQTASSQDVVDVLHFDPFKKNETLPEVKPSGDTDKAKSGKGDAIGGKDSSSANEGATEAPTQVPTQVPTSASPSDDQVKHWKDLADHYKNIAEGGKGKTETPPEDVNKIPAYNFTVPKELLKALTTGDNPEEFEHGIVSLCKGIAGAVHAQMLGHLEKLYSPRFESVPTLIAKAIEADRLSREVSSDFYGTYPELNHPAIKDLVKKVGGETAIRLKKTGWDQELRDETAKTVKALIAAASGQKPTEAPTKPPAKMLGKQGTRPPINDSGQNKDIADIIDTFF